jgi:hypothetical protein
MAPPSTNELAGGGEGLFERFLQLIPPERISQDRVKLALQYRRPCWRIENLDDLRGVSHLVAAAISFVNDTKQHSPCSAGRLGQLQERVLGQQPPSAFRPAVEDDLDHRD